MSVSCFGLIIFAAFWAEPIQEESFGSCSLGHKTFPKFALPISKVIHWIRYKVLIKWGRCENKQQVAPKSNCISTTSRSLTTDFRRLTAYDRTAIGCFESAVRRMFKGWEPGNGFHDFLTSVGGANVLSWASGRPPMGLFSNPGHDDVRAAFYSRCQRRFDVKTIVVIAEKSLSEVGRCRTPAPACRVTTWAWKVLSEQRRNINEIQQDSINI